MEIHLFEKLLKTAVDSGASDIHAKVGSPLMIRENKNLLPITDNRLYVTDVEMIAGIILSTKGSTRGKEDVVNMDDIKDLDTSFSLPNVGRFRVNIYRQRGTLAVSMRVIPKDIPSVEKYLLPEVLKEIALEPRGLVLVTGSTGSGKSTTLAAMIDYINNTQARKIVTIEDPIEFLIPDKLSALSQREVGTDTVSFAAALRSALRQDPDIILVGEMRDKETIEIALKATETGHTVFSTVHTRDAVSTITRLLAVFEAGEQASTRLRLAESLRAVISQRLIPRKDKEGRIAAIEIMRMTTTIHERILSADPKGFSDLIEQGTTPYQMQTFDQHLTELYKKEIITFETAMAAATSPTNFKRNLQFEGK